MHWLTFAIRRWWWRKWHPLVRVGWIVSQRSVTGLGTAVGVGLIGFGLMARSRKTLHLYNTTIPAGEEITIRVVQNGRTIASG
ncbi:MAG: hypothetical protein ACR2NG_05760 [Acidimicrobiia bacterium]